MTKKTEWEIERDKGRQSHILTYLYFFISFYFPFLFHLMTKKHLLLIYQLENLVRENKKMICTKEIEKLLKRMGNVK